MENAVDALKIAFAVMVLVIALTVSIVCFSMAKSTAEYIISSKDKTNYYEYQGAVGKASENRIVGIETIIPTLYRYYKENYTVVFKVGEGYNSDEGTFSTIKYLNVYETKADLSRNKLGTNKYNEYETLLRNKYGKSISNEIFSFDLSEEILRDEPWTGSIDKIKANLDAFLNGSTYISPINNQDYINYGRDRFLGSTSTKKGFIGKYQNAKFVETVSEYKYSAVDNENEFSSNTKEKTKRIITYTLIKE